MEIETLSNKICSYLGKRPIVNSLSQCITELILNSIDAKSKAITIRIDIQSFNIQIVDNGNGISLFSMNSIGNRFKTSKCRSLEDLATLKSYGFRGKSLNDIKALSRSLSINSRLHGFDETYLKIYKNGIWDQVKMVNKRPTHGTTIVVQKFLYNNVFGTDKTPELENIKYIIKSIAIVNHHTSICLKDDKSKEILLRSNKTKTVLQALHNFYPDVPENTLISFKSPKAKLSVSGLIGKVYYKNENIQYTYLNKRPIDCKSIKQLINSLIENYIPNFNENKRRFPIYIINITCPYTEINVRENLLLKNIEFTNWNDIYSCITTTLNILFKRGNHFAENMLINDLSVDGNSEIEENAKIFSGDSWKSKHSNCLLNSPKKQTNSGNRITNNEEEEGKNILMYLFLKSVSKENARKDRKRKRFDAEIDYARHNSNKIPRQQFQKTNYFDQNDSGNNGKSNNFLIPDIFCNNDNQRYKTIDANKFSSNISIHKMNRNSAPIFDFHSKNVVPTNMATNYNFFNDIKKKMPDQIINPANYSTACSGLFEDTLLKNVHNDYLPFNEIQQRQFKHKIIKEDDNIFKKSKLENCHKNMQTKYNIFSETKLPVTFSQLKCKKQVQSMLQDKNFVNEKKGQDNMLFQNVSINNFFNKTEKQETFNCENIISDLYTNNGFDNVREDNQCTDITYTLKNGKLKNLFECDNLQSNKNNVPQNSKWNGKMEAKLKDKCNIDKHFFNSDLNVFDFKKYTNSSKIKNNNTDFKEKKSQINDFWRENKFGKTFFIHKQTGMSLLTEPKNDHNFFMMPRIECVPKGFSQIIKKEKEIPYSFSPKSKEIFNRAILTSYEDELSTIKWTNYINCHTDISKFFNELYNEKSKQMNCSILNACVNKLPKSIRIRCNFEVQSLSKNLLNNTLIIGQLDKKFIVILIKENDLLILLDQHAVHERIRLENLLEEYKNIDLNDASHKFKSTKCPEVIMLKLNETEINLLRNYKKTLSNLGIQYNIFENEVLIETIPSCIQHNILKHPKKNQTVMIQQFISALLLEEFNALTNNDNYTLQSPNVLQSIVNSEACRGAIKFGDYLTLTECEKLVESLSKCNLPFQCAHGRPTIAPLINLNGFFEKTVTKVNLKKLQKSTK